MIPEHYREGLLEYIKENDMEYKTKITMIPEHCREGLLEYIEHGRPVGDFLFAVLENNLREAFWKADEINQAALRQYIDYLYGYCPSQCWGSRAKVNAWIEKRSLDKIR